MNLLKWLAMNLLKGSRMKLYGENGQMRIFVWIYSMVMFVLSYGVFVAVQLV